MRFGNFGRIDFFRIFALLMENFVPHNIDDSASFEVQLLGDVKAGFPSPAEEIREKLDLIQLLVKHRASTFFFRFLC